MHPDPESHDLPDRATFPDHTVLLKLANTRMPFGKYRGRLLIDLPEPYVVCFRGQGYPAGELGVMMASLYEIKANRLESLLRPLVRDSGGSWSPPEGQFFRNPEFQVEPDGSVGASRVPPRAPRRIGRCVKLLRLTEQSPWPRVLCVRYGNSQKHRRPTDRTAHLRVFKYVLGSEQSVEIIRSLLSAVQADAGCPEVATYTMEAQATWHKAFSSRALYY